MIELYTDGSSRKDGAGYAVVIIKDNKIISTITKQFEKGTNNEMELAAILSALQYAVRQDEDCIIFSDSAYCVNMCNDWIYKWYTNGWVRDKNKEIKNLVIIKMIYNYLTQDCNNHISIQKIKGHCNEIGNEIADAIASDNIKKFNKLFDKNRDIFCNF